MTVIQFELHIAYAWRQKWIILILEDSVFGVGYGNKGVSQNKKLGPLNRVMCNDPYEDSYHILLCCSIVRKYITNWWSLEYY